MAKVAFPRTTFSDSNGNPVANGYALLSLSSDGSSNDGAVCGGFPLRVNLDEGGVMAAVPQVWPNNLIYPGGTVYLITVYSASGELAVGPLSVSISTQIVTVPATAMPWISGLPGNVNFQYATPFGLDGTDPIVVPCSPGQTIRLTASGFITTDGGADIGPNGVGYAPGIYPFYPVYGTWATYYCYGDISGTVQECGLMGAFTDSNGNMVAPIAVGVASSFIVPSGATQMQLGINDVLFSDNAGSFTVTVEIN